MKFEHTNRNGFLIGLVDLFTAGLFLLCYMPRGLQDELDEILGHRTQRYYVAYLLGIPTLFIYTLRFRWYFLSEENTINNRALLFAFVHDRKEISL